MIDDCKIRRLIIGGLTCALVIGSAVWFYSTYDSYRSEVKSKSNELAVLSGDLDALKVKAESNTLSQEKMKETAHSAKNAGEAVATLENSYMTKVQQKPKTEEEENAQRADLLKMSDQFDEYFGKNTSMRTAWYTWDSEQVETVTWNFCTNYTFTEDFMNVLWKCVDSSNQILAYATAIYEAETDTFANPEVHVTVVGMQYLPYTSGHEGDLSVDMDLNTIWDTMDQISLPDDFNEQYQSQANDPERLQGVEANKNAAAALRDQMTSGGVN